MNVVDIHKDWSRHNTSGRPQPPQRSTPAEAVPATLVAHASSADNIKRTLIPVSPDPKSLGQSHNSTLNFVHPAPTPLPTGITHPFQSASDSEYGTTDDEYHVLNKDDIPKPASEFNQKPGGWPKQASSVRWISEDQQPLLVPSGLVTSPPIGAYPKPSTQIQPSPFARFLSRPAKERKQLPSVDAENQMVLSKSQITLGQTNNQIRELEDNPKPIQSEAQLQTVLGQFGGPIAVLGLGSMYKL